jgi:hypothetical protein
MFINEIQSQKLDRILSAFGEEEYLDIKDILDIEPIERKANGLIEVLKNRGLITRMGDTEENLLPMMLFLDPSADFFIDNGGFVSEFHRMTSNQGHLQRNHITINSSGNGNVINTGDNNIIDNFLSRED